MLRRPKPPIGARGVMQIRAEKGANGEGGACRAAEAGRETQAANGRERAWRCREEAVGGGRSRTKFPPLTRAGRDAPGGRGASVGENGKKGKRDGEAAERPVRDSVAGNKRERRSRY